MMKMSKNLIKFPHISCAVFKLSSQASEHKHESCNLTDMVTWKSDISSKQVIPASWKDTLWTQDFYLMTILKRANCLDLSEEEIDNINIVVEIVDEFIFSEYKQLSAMQELQLLEIF